MPDERVWVSRHGTAADEDEIWTNFTCSGEVCVNYHTSYRFPFTLLILNCDIDILPFKNKCAISGH